MTEFVVPTCPRCGHTEGEHRTNRGHILAQPRLGVCLRPGCDCRGDYTPDPEPADEPHPKAA